MIKQILEKHLGKHLKHDVIIEEIVEHLKEKRTYPSALDNMRRRDWLEEIIKDLTT